MKMTEEEIEAARAQSRLATANAKAVLKSGDKIRVARCCRRKATITVLGWDGNWITSKSGIAEYSAVCVDRLNGKPVDFTQPQP